MRLSSRELTEWMAFYALEPWGSDVESWRFGMIAAVIANVNRDSKKQPRAFTPQDFMPNQKPKQQTIAEQIAIMKSVG